MGQVIMSKRNPTAAEIDTLQESLVAILSKEPEREMLTASMSCAGAITAAFDVLYGVTSATPEAGRAGSAADPTEDVPFVHPANLSALELLDFVSSYANKLKNAIGARSYSLSAQDDAADMARRAQQATAEFLEASGLLSRASTLFPENLETADCYQGASCRTRQSLPAADQKANKQPDRHAGQGQLAQSSSPE